MYSAVLARKMMPGAVLLNIKANVRPGKLGHEEAVSVVSSPAPCPWEGELIIDCWTQLIE